MKWKSVIRTMPVIGQLSYVVWPARSHRDEMPFESSSRYWEDRYRQGGNSGAGSYNRLARFKAEVLNRFVADRNIQTVIEFGCGDGAQLELASYPAYVGVDVSETILEIIRKRFSGVQDFRFIHTSAVSEEPPADLSLSLDVIYHLVEDDVFDSYMRALFAKARQFVIIYASNAENGWPAPHVRHRRFTDWTEVNAPDFRLIEHMPNRYPFDANDPGNTSFADFFIFEKSS